MPPSSESNPQPKRRGRSAPKLPVSDQADVNPNDVVDLEDGSPIPKRSRKNAGNLSAAAVQKEAKAKANNSPAAADKPSATITGDQPAAADKPSATTTGDQPAAADKPSATVASDEPAAAEKPSATITGDQPEVAVPAAVQTGVVAIDNKPSTPSTGDRLVPAAQPGTAPISRPQPIFGITPAPFTPLGNRTGPNPFGPPAGPNPFGPDLAVPGLPVPAPIGTSTAASGFKLPPDATDLFRSLAEDVDSDEHEEADYSDVFWYDPPGEDKWVPKNVYVCGKMLGWVGSLGDAPPSNDENQMTAWAYLAIRKHATAAVQRLSRYITKPRRMLELRGGAGRSLKGPQRNADALWHQIFGHEHAGKDEMCGSCKNELGPFQQCVQVDGACANCRYGGNATRCSFHPNYTGPPSSGSKRKSGNGTDDGDASDDDIRRLLGKIPAKHIRTLVSVFNQVLDR